MFHGPLCGTTNPVSPTIAAANGMSVAYEDVHAPAPVIKSWLSTRMGCSVPSSPRHEMASPHSWQSRKVQTKMAGPGSQSRQLRQQVTLIHIIKSLPEDRAALASQQ